MSVSLQKCLTLDLSDLARYYGFLLLDERYIRCCFDRTITVRNEK